MFSRLALERPLQLVGELALRHLEAGLGLSCLEKTRLLAWYLDQRGIANAIVGGALEFWVDGVNLMAARGSATAAPDEALLRKYFALDRKASPYESSPQMSHWACWFELDGEPHLIDCIGDVAVFRHFSGDDVVRLLDQQPKAYVDYQPTARIYYHRFSQSFLDLLTRRSELDEEFTTGRMLGNATYMGGRLIVIPRWWWREPSFRASMAQDAQLTAHATGGEATLRFVEHPAELRQLEGLALPEHLQRGFEAAWPTMLGHIARIFDAPAYVRLSVQQTRRPMRDYSTHAVQFAR